MSAKEILDHNKKVFAKIEAHEAAIRDLKKKVKAPCGFCPYDGMFRCEACHENRFEGFNIRDYPR